MLHEAMYNPRKCSWPRGEGVWCFDL